MSQHVDVIGPQGLTRPQAVVLIDPATGLTYAASGGAGGGAGGGLTDAELRATAVPVNIFSALDSTGVPFNPDSCTHTYAYSAGLLVTDTATLGATSWVKTFGYAAGVLSTESKWVRQ